ncbi:venom serine carboxypeptidase-like [Cotesia glomerata]|uniref:venom serine carboxypeptidase-like n=1 Tax=Cotesia glomerata TaxID=32391 RepID=UPI001D02E1BC|nr:venom serine carboxypeptidase-like [Cotesia glomerata]
MKVEKWNVPHYNPRIYETKKWQEVVYRSPLFTLFNNHNVIYIDSPVGTGYSFTDNNHGYARTESKIYKDLYSGSLQFYQLFPELQSNPLFITGECYAGKYIPAFSYLFHQKNPTAKIKINLEGIIIIGNGFVDPINQMNFWNHLHEIGLLDLNGKVRFNLYEEKIRSLIKSNQLTTTAEVLDELLFNFPSVLSNLTGFQSYPYNYLDNQNPDDWNALVEWIQRPDVQSAIHVSDHTPFMSINQTILEYLLHEFMKSEADKLAKLLPDYKVVFYNRQLDMVIPYSSIENVLLNLQWEGSDELKNASRSVWWSGDELVGYVTKVRNLSVVLIRNAGHASGIEQPKWVLEVIT